MIPELAVAAIIGLPLLAFAVNVVLRWLPAVSPAMSGRDPGAHHAEAAHVNGVDAATDSAVSADASEEHGGSGHDSHAGGNAAFVIGGSKSDLAGWVTVGAVAGSFVLSLWALIAVVGNGAHDLDPLVWLSTGDGGAFQIRFSLMLDQLTAIMLVVVSGVSLLVQVYGIGYMHHDRSTTRYFAYMAFFTASMLGLVTAGNVVQLFVFWELVGISSYLLIGFWMDRPSAAAAAKKAFLMTRLGDFGFLLGILYLYYQDPTYLDIGTLYSAIAGGMIVASVASWIAAGFLLGAIGKSAQFPLHSWLPDAMEGPTSVSALIHSATMVTAGVFLVARFFPLFLASDIMWLVAIVGAVTAVFAATMALVADDVKRVLAYSTVSQLGYMMFALGIGAYGAAVFHLFTHAFFKAGLFLAAGSVHHAAGTFNMRYIGGLRTIMPITYIVMVVCSLSLAGIAPLSGFWSKDEILDHAFDHPDALNNTVFVMGLVAAFMTAFYMFRAVYLTFHGQFRGGGNAEREHLLAAGDEVPEGLERPHLSESPSTMTLPLMVLAVLAVVVGFLVNPVVDLGVIDHHAFSTFLVGRNTDVFADSEAQLAAGSKPEASPLVAAISTVVALAGIGLATLLYMRGRTSVPLRPPLLEPIYLTLRRKYWVDELYEGLIVRRLFYSMFAYVVDRFDTSWLDNVNVLVYKWTDRLGRGLAQGQTGQLQVYGIVSVVGVAAAVILYVVLA